jgi:zinc transporter ZupT
VAVAVAVAVDLDVAVAVGVAFALAVIPAGRLAGIQATLPLRGPVRRV